MTQAWAWVSDDGRVAVGTVRVSCMRCIGSAGEVWTDRVPEWFSEAARRGYTVGAMAEHGWHLKRVSVEPVEG